MRKYLVLTGLLLLAGCTTPYQPAVGQRPGYSHIKLAYNRVKVTVTGREYDTVHNLQNIALLRAAELCLRGGFPRLVVMDTGADTIVTYTFFLDTPIPVEYRTFYLTAMFTHSQEGESAQALYNSLTAQVRR